MRFLIDADLPKSTKGVVRQLGFYLEDVRNIGLGNKSDADIIKYAKLNDFIIITRDLDFGNIPLYPIKLHKGVIILRLPYLFISKQINNAVSNFLKSITKEKIKNSIVIVELGRYRIRRSY